MADHEQQSGPGPLTERELAALQILARKIVREAGLTPDPEKEAAEKEHQQFIEGGREYYKAQVDFFKHMTTLSGATVVAVPVVSKAFLPNPALAWFLWLAEGLLLLAALFSTLGLRISSAYLAEYAWGMTGREPESFPEWTHLFSNGSDIRSKARSIVVLLFYSGLFLFALAFVVNASS